MKWFTVEAVDSETFALSEYGHWEKTHSYLLLGRDRALLIDTGLGVADIREAAASLTELPVQAALTHAHWDHMGGLAAFPDFALHEAEAPWLTGGFPLPEAAVRAQLTRDSCAFPEGFSPGSCRVFQGPPARLLREGDRLELGGRTLQVLHTPGHSPGHVCYYEPERGYLFSGDLIYGGCLDAWYPSTDPKAFRHSVERAAGLEVRRLLPGHRDLDVSPALIGQVRDAFCHLAEQGNLRHGAGVFSFGAFSIHL